LKHWNKWAISFKVIFCSPPVALRNNPYLNTMCDTFICPASSSATGHAIFGKNSDREPNEVQFIRRYPQREIQGRSQTCTYITVEHVKSTHEVIVSQPVGMWGAEMGINEHGLCIGNEAVFTKMPLAKKDIGLTGMDMLRLALESCADAEQAVDKIIALNSEYGQDANGGYRQKFYYHNSFIVSDASNAFVLETAGPFWVVEKVKGHRAISNGLSIGSDFHEIHPDAMDFALKKGWIKAQDDFDFAKAFSAYWMPRLARCNMRRMLNESYARKEFSVKDAFAALRSHAEQDFLPHRGTTANVCMHASGLLCPQQTTSSMVAEIRKGGPHTVWLTGTSTPCLSVFKPFYFGDDLLNEHRFSELWLDWESWLRVAIHDYKVAFAAVDARRKPMETAWVNTDASAASERKNLLLQTLSAQAADATILLLEDLKKMLYKLDSPLLYRLLWKKHQRTFY
jgi:dipeptidase